jgi:glycine hydroxymethyltransferase
LLNAAKANIITNKNLIPQDRPEDWDSPGGLRLGTTEVTRLGMGEAEMEAIGNFIVRIVSGQDRPEALVNDLVEFRSPFQTLYYCFENGLPPNMATAIPINRENRR